MNGKVPGALVAFLAVCEIAFAITIIALISDQLYVSAGYYTVCGPVGCVQIYSDGTCLMTNNSINVCRYGFSVAAWGLLVSIFMMFAWCVGPMVTAVLAAFNSVWWLAFSITATVYSGMVHDDTDPFPGGYPRGNYRVMVYALSWTTFVCCLITIPLALMMKKKEQEVPAAAGAPTIKAEAAATPDHPDHKLPDEAKAPGMPPSAAMV